MGSESGRSLLPDYLRKHLHLEHATVRAEVALPGGVRADLVIETADTTFVLEVKRGLLNEAAVAKVLLYRDLYARTHPGGRVVAVLVGTLATAAVRELLDHVDVLLVEAPPALLPEPARPTGETPLTTEKSWAVFTALLRTPALKGVRALAEESGVSIGWTHRTLQELSARGIAEKGPHGVALRDPARMLDVVPLERPLKRLDVDTVPTEFASAHEAAVELTRALSREGAHQGPIPFAFGGYTAAALHTGYAHRHDRVDLYVDPSALRRCIGTAQADQGVKIHVLKPDRDVGHGARTIDHVRVVSPDLALLDVAGLGYAARDVAIRMLETYGPRNPA